MFRRGLLQDYSASLSAIARAVDVVAISLAGIVSYAWWIDIWPILVEYQVVLLLACLLIFVLFPVFGLYRSWRGKSLLDEVASVSSAWVLVAVVLIVLAFMLKVSSHYSRVWMTAWFISGFLAIAVFRFAYRMILRAMRRRGWNHRSIVILGAGVLGNEVAQRVLDAAWSGLDIAAFLDDNDTLHGKTIAGVQVKGNIDALASIMQTRRIDEVWIALPLRAEHRVKEVLQRLQHEMTVIRYVPDVFGFRLLNHSITDIAGVPVIDLNLTPMVGVNRLIKAIEDRILAAAILLFVSPLLLVIACGIKLTSPGPVIFRQQRLGWDGKPFVIYKFRTMIEHSETEGKVTQATRHDPRVTEFGAFLRRFSLDELPQFINVLQGHMSIVGPRPHALAHNEEYKGQVEAYMQRHKVKPGITGWAQVHGQRGETQDVEKMRLRVQYDLYYINHWSLWLDLKIIVLTLFRGFAHPNAY
jgi:Undecaprenyl-phosphate glucose phosphotransferase